jgi:cardiolipin synthase (CMP-forming)
VAVAPQPARDRAPRRVGQVVAAATRGGDVPGGRVSDRVVTVPNALSVLRLLLVPAFAGLILTHRDGWALLTLATSGITDYLDGALARRWGQVSRMGQLLDPAADRLYILSTLLGLAWREMIPWWLAVALISRDVILALTLPLLARVRYGPPPVHFLGKAATLNLLYAFPLLLLADGTGTAAMVARPVAWAFAWWGTALYWWAGWLYLRQVAGLIRAGTGAGAGAGAGAGDGTGDGPGR